jgi:hypothetical protein
VRALESRQVVNAGAPDDTQYRLRHACFTPSAMCNVIKLCQF